LYGAGRSGPAWHAADFEGTPLPPDLVESSGYAGERTKIFDFKELIGKIFRTKHLAHDARVLQGHARRVTFTY
jgi:hypothetical protein